MTYLDYNATTPLDPRVVDKMQLFFTEHYGNASSLDHVFGWEAAEAVEEARERVADFIGARPDEIVFTGSATESINCGLRGLTVSASAKSVITIVTEHEAVLSTCRYIAAQTGLYIHSLPADGFGRIDPTSVVAGCRHGDVAFISAMLANNEIGTIQTMDAFSQSVRSATTILFSDLTQAAGKIPINVQALEIDVAAFSAHKVYGPKGVGALFIRSGKREVEVKPLIVGGGQERGLRAGTVNVPGIVGFGEACRIALLEMKEEAERVSRLRDKLEDALLAELPDLWVNGDRANRLPNTTNIGFRGVDARALIRDMHDIAVSTRSACSSRSRGPSHVLKALGLTDDEAYSCIRFSLGRFTTQEEIDYTIERVVTSVRKLRSNLST